MILHKSSYHYHYQRCVKKMTIHIRDKCEERPIYRIYIWRIDILSKKKKKMREFYRVFA